MPLPHYRLTVTNSEADADHKFVHQQLIAFNRAALPEFFNPDTVHHINVYLRDEQDELIGGILCETHWDSLQIDILWVDASLRGQGAGSQLLERAEAEAMALGCRWAGLTTFDFQARGFYEKHGFRVVGQYDGYPPGHTYYMMRKDFTQEQIR
jgi:GNAT superfamily N-acetyltransferase